MVEKHGRPRTIVLGVARKVLIPFQPNAVLDLKRPAILTIALLLMLLSVLPQSPAEAAGPLNPFFISGTAVNETGVPLVNVNVSATNVTTHFSYHALTDVTGNYNISLPAGTYNLSAAMVNRTANVTYHNVLVGPGNVTGLEFTLSEVLGHVSGHVTSGEVALGGVTITLSGAKDYVATSTNPFGAFSFNGVQPGAYVAKASKIGYNDSYYPKPVDVTRGSSVEITFTLQPQFSLVFGRVSLGGNPEEGVKVVLLSGSQTMKEAQTDANGNYSLNNVIAGDYVLQFSKAGLQERFVPISVAPNREQRLDLSMQLAPVEGLRGFIGDLDLTHSLMVVGLVIAILMTMVALLIRSKGAKNPKLLAFEGDEASQLEKKEQKGKDDGSTE